MKSLRIPLLQNLEEQDLDTAIELGGQTFRVDSVNWPGEFPYAPLCAGRIARTGDSLVVDFRVSGLDLRVQNMADRGRIWEDSACEFFVQVPGSDEYINFEVNVAGRLLACRGTGRDDRKPLPDEALASIVRITAVEGLSVTDPIDYAGGLWNWRIMLVIPLDIIGVDTDALPEKLRGNFYKCGDLTAHPHFSSWSPVGTEHPDFHRPEYFGELLF
ncbi:MAG: hypothetical protein IK031_04665 [Bacteroidales bacterium]|nr:hypothetical protein [Bacteroidales bacterium]